MSSPPLRVTEEQIAAAQLRIVLDEKLGRQTPNVVRRIAAMTSVESDEPRSGSDLRDRTYSNVVAGLAAGQHLAVDAVGAFVDGELGAVALDRAAAHLTMCQSCAAEVAAQRLARSVVRSAHLSPPLADLLAALRAIPQDAADLATTPEERSEAERRAVLKIRRWVLGEER